MIFGMHCRYYAAAGFATIMCPANMDAMTIQCGPLAGRKIVVHTVWQQLTG